MTTGTKTIAGIVLAVAVIAAGVYVINNTTITFQKKDIQQEKPEKLISPNDSSNPAGTVEAGSSDAQKCTSQGGAWSEEYKECTNVSKGSCQEIGGTFNECESACRHNPESEVCIAMCVGVCTL